MFSKAQLSSHFASLGLADFLKVGGFPLLARLSLLYLLFRPLGTKWERACLLLLAGLGLVAEGITRQFWFWAAVLLFTVLQITWASDNHVYLFAYWLLTLVVATLWSAPEEVCRANARWMLALSMAFAVVWKAFLSPDFVNGTFFHTTFFLDHRFKDFAALMGGMTDELWNYNRFLFAEAETGALPGPIFLKSTQRLWVLAVASTWWTLLIEGLVALLFLVPLRWRCSKYREWALLGFIASTYAVAPVAGFGWLLTILGIAQCDKERRAIRLLFLGLFVLILAYSTGSITKALVEATKPDPKADVAASPAQSVPFVAEPTEDTGAAPER